MVSGLNTYGYGYNSFNITAQQPYSSPELTSFYQQPVLTGGVSTTSDAYASTKDNTADGKDDGSIGFLGAATNFAKGVIKFVTGPFTDEKGDFSLSKTLKSVAIGVALVGLNMIPGVGQVLTPALLTLGAVAGGVGMAKAGYNIATAKTDAEAEAAWQSMGSSTATLATTVIGAKGYAKAQASSAAEAEALASGASAEEAAQAGAQAATRYDGIAGARRAVGKTFADTGRNISSGVSKGWQTATNTFGKVTQSYKDGTLKSKVTAKYESTRQAANKTYNEFKTAAKEFRADWKSLSKEEQKEVIASLKSAAKDAAKDAAKARYGTGKKEIAQHVLADAKEIVSKPGTIGIHNYLTTQTIKPNFYDSLSTEEQRCFDALPKDEQEQLVKDFYSKV